VGSSCATELAAGQSCAYSVTFEPQNVGNKRGVLRVNLSTRVEPREVKLQGTGVRHAPTPTVTPSRTPAATPSPTATATPMPSCCETTPAPTPTSTSASAIGPLSENGFGTGSVPATSIPGTVEPSDSNETGLLLLSVVAIDGEGSSSATINLPTAPGPWTLIGDWSCNSGFGSEIQVAAAYRFTTSGDASGTPFTWSFSSPFEASVVNTLYTNVNVANPIDVLGSSACGLGDSGSVVVAPGITTTKNSDMILALFDAAGANQSVMLPQSGSDLGPVMSETNSGEGPANFNAFGDTSNIGTYNNGRFGAAGLYGPFAAIQGASGETLGVLLSLQHGM